MNRYNYYHLVFITHVGCAGAPHEVRSFATDFHRKNRLELAKGSIREISIIQPVRERNEQAWSTTSHSVVEAENKCEQGLKVMALLVEVSRDSGSHQDQSLNGGLNSHVHTYGIYRLGFFLLTSSDKLTTSYIQSSLLLGCMMSHIETSASLVCLGIIANDS